MRKVAKRMKSSEKRLGRNHHTKITVHCSCHLFFVLLQDNLVWYWPKQWYHPSGTKKERKTKGKKAKELFEKAQGKAGHTTAVTSLVFTLSGDHLYTSSGLQSNLEGTQGFG